MDIPARLFSGLLWATFFWGLTLFSPWVLSAQNYASVDKLALNTPPSKTASVKILSDYLCAEQPDETHKIRAIYAWITLNIAYFDSTDEDELWATPEHIKRQNPEQVLRNQNAVCQGFANLFCALAKEAGIPCEVATGLVKNADGTVERIGHAWAVARVENQWHLFDPTWAVPAPGLNRWIVKEPFFKADPERFLLQHLPDDPVWQLLNNPITEEQFRNLDDEAILEFIRLEPLQQFNFRDTLQLWAGMDSVSRILQADARVLQFNGSNERVVFGLGQRYWGLFFELLGELDSLADAAILTDVPRLDTLEFEAQLAQMQVYHERARQLFANLQSAERLVKAEKFYSPQDVAALVEKTRGDLRAGLFENHLFAWKETALSPSQIAELNYQYQLAKQHYARAGVLLDCEKLDHSCFDIWHNLSMMALEMAERQVRTAQAMANEKTATKQIKSIRELLNSARIGFGQSIDACQKMNRKPPRFALVEERLLAAEKGLISLRGVELRVERTSLNAEAEAILGAAKMPLPRAQKLLQAYQAIARASAYYQDTLLQVEAKLEEPFIQIAKLNFHLENYALQFNLSNIQFRVALENYEQARQNNTLTAQSDKLHAEGNKALRSLKEATVSMDFIEDTGRLSDENLQQKHAQIDRLSKNIRSFLNSF